MSDAAVTLYGSGFSRSFRVLWALEEAGVEYNYVAVDFTDQSEKGRFGPQYSGLNSQGKVPALVDNELVMTESAAMVNYIASKAEDLTLKPADGTTLRAKYDEMCFFILCELEQPLWNKGKHKFALPEQYRVSEMLPETIHFEFEKAQQALLTLMGNNEYAIGDHFTMADVLLAQTLGWAMRFEFEVNQKLITYYERIIERAAFKRAQAVVS